MAKFGKWIGGGLGWAVGGPIGAIVGFVIGSIVDGTTAEIQTRTGPGPFGGRTTGYSARTTTGGYVMSLLILTAAVMKADNRILKSELDYVKKFMVQNFGSASAQEAVKMLRDILKQNIPVNEVCNQIRQNMNYSARLQLLHFLFGIAQADGEVDPSEQRMIEQIATQIGIGAKDYQSIQAMFVRDTTSDYKILEIEPSASNDELKKAYRRMAMKYHPDKVSHLGEDFQKAAKDKFQKVSQAYENIKKERKIA
ncbi:MAG: TerB family tellurite resistance protein [Prolixibacteraceae bacterium]